MQRRTFLTLSAAAAASAALPLPARAAVPKPYSWDTTPPMDNGGTFVKWMQENRGEDPNYLRARFDRFQNMVGHVDLWEARNKRAFLLTPREEFTKSKGEPHDHLRRQLPRYRFWRDHLGTARRRAHDQLDRPQDGREGARDRDRLRLSVGLSREPHRQGVDDRDHQAAGRAHARPLRRPHRARLHRIQGDHQQERRRLLRLGGGGAVRQDHRHLRHRPHSAAAAAAAQDRRHHGDPGRAAGRGSISSR